MGEVAVGDPARCRRPAHPGGRRHRGDDRAALLRGRVLRRDRDRGGRGAPVAHRDARLAQVRPAGADRIRRVPQPADLRGRTDDRGDRPDSAVRHVGCSARTTRVRLAPALQLPEADLPVPPYALGAWLGDGTTAAAQITSADPEILLRIEADGFSSRRAPQPRCGTPSARSRNRRRFGPVSPMARCGGGCGRSGSSATSTSPTRTSERPRLNAAPCSPVCSTLTAQSFRLGTRAVRRDRSPALARGHS